MLEDARDRHHPKGMLLRVLRSEEGARFPQIGRGWIEPEGLQHAHYAARRFRQRRVLDEQRFPNQIGLLAPGERPELFRTNRAVTEQFRNQVMIVHQLINAPQ